MRFKIDWASLIVGSKCIVFALFYFVFEGNFPSTSPRGAYIWRGDLTGGFCVTNLRGLYLELLIHGGSYFRNFTVAHLYLLYDDIYSVRIWITSFRRFWYKYRIHEHRVQVRIGSSTPPAGKVRFKSYFKLSTNFTFVAIRQVKIMIKIPIISNVDLSLMNGVQKRGTVVCKLEL